MVKAPIQKKAACPKFCCPVKPPMMFQLWDNVIYSRVNVNQVIISVRSVRKGTNTNIMKITALIENHLILLTGSASSSFSKQALGPEH